MNMLTAIWDWINPLYLGIWLLISIPAAIALGWYLHDRGDPDFEPPYDPTDCTEQLDKVVRRTGEWQ